METEIKLLLPPGARTAVEEHPLFAAAPSRRIHNVSTYYDTPDFALRARGVSLRLRRADDHFIQTVKSLDGGFASRGEWERPVASDALDAEALARDPEALTRVGDTLDRLRPLFTTDVDRTVRVLTLDGRTTVETAIDEGEVRSGDRRRPLGELELELKGGPLGPMLRLAADLVRLGALRWGSQSKGERGYGLLTDALPPTRDAADLVLPDDVTLRDAVPLMLGAAAKDMAGDLSPAARGDVEGVHRLRAAIRKMRTLFVLFAPHLEPTRMARFDEDLRGFGRVLGSGRDWDVFLTETLVEAEETLGADTLAPLEAQAAIRRAEAHAAVRAAAEGPLPTDLLLGLGIWMAEGAWCAGDEADQALRDLLPDLLDRLERKARRRGRHLKSLDTEDLHDLRKSLKKLRYACEDVSSLFGRAPVDRYVSTIKKVLQDLGHINDAAVTAGRVAELAMPGRPDIASAAAALLAWNAKRRKGSERDLRRRWRRFRDTDPFWA